MMRTETKGRARALQLLYAAEANDQTVAEVVPGLSRLIGPQPTVLDVAEHLAGAVMEDRAALDDLIRTAAEHWRIDRLAVIDRNILRLGALELKGASVPPVVAIDEALWLAHRFGTRESPAFVNGVLDRIARSLGRL